MRISLLNKEISNNILPSEVRNAVFNKISADGEMIPIRNCCNRCDIVVIVSFNGLGCRHMGLSKELCIEA